MNTPMPVVTVVTVCRNARAHIRECIDSVRQQKLPAEAIEHVVIDGLSDDGTAEIVQAAARTGLISRYVSEKDGGVYDAMNKGLRLARGQYVALLNSDDWYLPDMLPRSLQAATENNADYVVSDAWACDPSGRRVFRFRADPESSCWEAPYAHPTLLCRRDVYTRLNGYDASFRIAGDYDLMWRLRRLGYTCAVLRAGLTCYRQGGLSAGDNYGEVLAIYTKNAEQICAQLNSSKLSLVGFLAVGTQRLAQMLTQSTPAERPGLFRRAQEVYLQIGLLDAVQHYRMAGTWQHSLGGVIAVGVAGSSDFASQLGQARRLRARYVLQRHGLLAAGASAVRACVGHIQQRLLESRTSAAAKKRACIHS